MLSTNKELLELISPSMLGAIWITKEKLSTDLKFFNELNYLFDGLLSEYIYNFSGDGLPKSQSFITNSFNKKLWLIHAIDSISESELNGQLDNLLKNASGNILIISNDQKKWEAKLPTKNSNLNFISILN